MSRISFEGLDTALRHFTASLEADQYVFEHRGTGEQFRVDAERLLQEYERRFCGSAIYLQPTGELIAFFAEYLPPLCYGCGTRLPRRGVCEPCAARQLAVLQRIVTAPPYSEPDGLLR